MKIVLIISFLISCLSSQAQNFTGKIVFGVSIEGDSSGLAEVFMPTSLEYSFGKSKMGLSITGGMAETLFGNILIDTKKEQIYSIDHQALSITEHINDLPETVKKITITKEADIDNILGYSCQKYKGVSVQNNQTILYWWVTEKFELPKTASKFDMMGFPVFNLPDVDGLVLRMVMESEGIIIKVEATELRNESVPDSEFSLPKNYTRLVKKASDKE